MPLAIHCGSLKASAGLDASESLEFSVGGSVSGLVGELGLSLNGSEALLIETDGVFTFVTGLQPGESYEVAVTTQPDGQTCGLLNALGEISTSNVADVEVVCAANLSPELTSLAFLGGFQITPSFGAAELAYQVDVSILVSELQLRATALDPLATITIDGETVDSGALSRPRALVLGDNIFAVNVETPSGDTRTYTTTVTRGAVLAQQVGTGKASNTGESDNFGTALALDGDTLAVGALEDSNGAQGDDSVEDSGAVFVFRRTGSTWAQEAYLKASNLDVDDNFGLRLALDGDTLVVAAQGEDSGGAESDESVEDSGAAYVFRRNGSTWTQEAYLKASNPGVDDAFGTQVDVSGDIIVVGARGEDSSSTGVNGAEDNDDSSASGAAYIFRRSGSSWTQEAYLKASNAGTDDRFGTAVRLDKDTVVIGAAGESSGSTGVNPAPTTDEVALSGAAYVFRVSGTTWTQEAFIKASNTRFDNQFGIVLAIDGDTLAVGTNRDASADPNDPFNTDASLAGACHIYQRTGSTWTQEAYIKAANPRSSDQFCVFAELSGDLLAVGAQGDRSASTGIDGSDDIDSGFLLSGAAYVFRRVGTTWIQESYIKASNTDAGDRFGSRGSLSGNTLVLGARNEDSDGVGIDSDLDNDNLPNSGAVYFFQ
jgi:hypothetical protein